MTEKNISHYLGVIFAGILIGLAFAAYKNPSPTECVYRVANSTHRGVIFEFGAATYQTVTEMRNQSQSSSKSQTIRLLLSVLTNEMRNNSKQLLAKRNAEFDITVQNETDFYVQTVIFDNENLNEWCAGNNDHVFIIDYPGYANQPDFVSFYSSYQVWMKCGLFENGDYTRIEYQSVWFDLPLIFAKSIATVALISSLNLPWR
uniref:Uncharacterized protein n=1 Tax=Caenorhabditis japonica TaxID=281687 RepID=A0A8R1EAI7_CAEJA